MNSKKMVKLLSLLLILALQVSMIIVPTSVSAEVVYDIVDDLIKDNTNWHTSSGNISYAASSPKVGSDNNRIYKTGHDTTEKDTNTYIVYKIEEGVAAAVKVETISQKVKGSDEVIRVPGDLKFETSADGIQFSEHTTVNIEQGAISGTDTTWNNSEWAERIYTATELPTGTKYVKIIFGSTKDCYNGSNNDTYNTLQMCKVSIATAEEGSTPSEPVVDPKYNIPYTDECADLNYFIESSNNLRVVDNENLGDTTKITKKNNVTDEAYVVYKTNTPITYFNVEVAQQKRNNTFSDMYFEVSETGTGDWTRLKIIEDYDMHISVTETYNHVNYRGFLKDSAAKYLKVIFAATEDKDFKGYENQLMRVTFDTQNIQVNNIAITADSSLEPIVDDLAEGNTKWYQATTDNFDYLSSKGKLSNDASRIMKKAHDPDTYIIYKFDDKVIKNVKVTSSRIKYYKENSSEIQKPTGLTIKTSENGETWTEQTVTEKMTTFEQNSAGTAEDWVTGKSALFEETVEIPDGAKYVQIIFGKTSDCYKKNSTDNTGDNSTTNAVILEKVELATESEPITTREGLANKFTVTAYPTTTNEAVESATVIVALYEEIDTNVDRLAAVDICSADFNAADPTINAKFDVTGSELTNPRIKMFVIDSIGNLRPMGTVRYVFYN